MPVFLLCPVILVSLDYKRLHFSGLHSGRMSAHVYSEYDISMPVFFFIGLLLWWRDNEIQVFTCFWSGKTNRKHLDFLFSSPGIPVGLWSSPYRCESVGNREKVLRGRWSHGILSNTDMWIVFFALWKQEGIREQRETAERKNWYFKMVKKEGDC